jgi:hypothetical protein
MTERLLAVLKVENARLREQMGEMEAEVWTAHLASARRLARIPLTVIAPGGEAEGVMVAVSVEQLDAAEARIAELEAEAAVMRAALIKARPFMPASDPHKRKYISHVDAAMAMDEALQTSAGRKMLVVVDAAADVVADEEDSIGRYPNMLRLAKSLADLEGEAK